MEFTPAFLLNLLFYYIVISECYFTVEYVIYTYIHHKSIYDAHQNLQGTFLTKAVYFLIQ